MAKHLVIVESPAKAKTIEGFLGTDFMVKSSFGHIRDLVKKGMGIDLANHFEPLYEVSEDKKKVVNELKKLSKNKEVWLATDEDREGEAIAWHLAEALKLPVNTTKRIVFHEITKSAIQHAVAHPRTINMDLVNAQQARRVVDRLVGFELSPVLWKKVARGLSAGRVQSVAVRLIVERERDIQQFEPQISYKASAHFVNPEASGNGQRTFTAKLAKDLVDATAASQFMQQAAISQFTVADLQQKPGKRRPSPPFTTSTLQQAAASRLGFSVRQTMTLAQRLYEAGKITYMRTDSVTLSAQAQASAAHAIEHNYGQDYVQLRQYKNKNQSAQEAHEAIRPTDFNVNAVGGERNEQRLYLLIWQRAIASQMAEAQLQKTQLDIALSQWPDQRLQAKGEVVTFPGFLAAYADTGKDDNVLLPKVSVGQTLELNELITRQAFSRAPARYNEAALVRVLEENGIGRPSTYAPTISTIQDRGYVEKEDRDGHPRPFDQWRLHQGQVAKTVESENTGVERNKLFPTDTALIVNDFLVAHFDSVVDYGFTAKLESHFDDIAHSSDSWQHMVDVFYQGFHPAVEAAEDIDRSEVSKTRVLGTDPVSGRPVSVRLGRFGPMAQIGQSDDEEPLKFAGLNKGQSLETIQLEEALALFKLPREIGAMAETFEAFSVDGTRYAVEAGQILIAKKGPFGPYIEYGEKRYASMKKDDDPLAIELADAMDRVKEKITKDAEKLVKGFGDSSVQIVKGRWGPYITDTATKINAKIAKDEDPQAFTLEQCVERLKTDGKAPARRGGRKTTAKKTTKKPSKKT